MATFSAVNTALPLRDTAQATGEQTPTTPKPPTTQAQAPSNTPVEDTSASTPTKHDFAPISHQRSLSDIPVARPVDEITKESQDSRKRDSLHLAEDAEDIDMAEGDDDNMEDDESDNDSVNGDSERPSKKKKGQRFFCRDFPPCQLSFTRSEHLARHIRKHTGERPFQCHCSRRFSRLDNLRQHAQTVHVNEEIPGDSLAATSTRFQRQIRTDRVRPPTNRSRASTMTSNGGHSRGHSRNLSTSSIGSTTSSIGTPDDTRRRPQPLAMANGARLTLDTYGPQVSGAPLQPPFTYYNQSPTGYSTPTSTVFSNGPDSPRYQSNMASPSSSLSRSTHYNGSRRRLSVPSVNAAIPQNGNSYPPPPMYFSPIHSGTASTFSQGSSVFGSPTSSVFSYGRRDSETDAEYRRRTWHSGTYVNYAQRPATSGLSYHQTPNDERPAMSDQPAASQVMRLPGIESFDHVPPSNTRQQSSPMMVDSSPRPPSSGRPSDAGLHQGLTRLDITAANAPIEGQWVVSQAPQFVHPQGYVNQQQPATIAPQQVHQHPVSMPEPPTTPRRNKRQAWYGGPMNPPSAHSLRPSPEDSGSSDGVPTPGTAQGAEYHPAIVHSSGMTDTYPPGPLVADEQKIYQLQQQQQNKPEPARSDSGFQSYVHRPSSQSFVLQTGHDPRVPVNYAQQTNNDMGRLEALVAVATSESEKRN